MSDYWKNIIIEEILSLKDRIAANIVSTKQNASGRTIQSLEVIETESGAQLWGRSPFGTLETGRKPGKVPNNFRDIILQWMKDKGIKATAIPYIRKPSDKWQPKYTPQQRGDYSLAGAIAYKIQTEGTSNYKMGGRDDVYSNEIPNTINSISQKLLGLFTTEVENIPLN